MTIFNLVNNPNLLARLLADSKNQPEIFRPTEFWRWSSQRIARELKKTGLEDFRRNSTVSKGFADAILKDSAVVTGSGNKEFSLKHELYRAFHRSSIARIAKSTVLREFDKQLRLLKSYRNYYLSDKLGNWFQEFSGKHDLPYTLLGNPDNTIRLNGELIGRNYLHAFMAIDNWSKKIEFEQVRSVLEIGGGFGCFAHSLLHLYPNIRSYVYVDIPPMLYIGTQYLKAFFGDRVLDYIDHCQKKKKGEHKEAKLVTAVPPWELENVVETVDLVVNNNSFQEMNIDVIDFYFSEIVRLINGVDDPHLCLTMYDSLNDKLLPFQVIIEEYEKLSPREIEVHHVNEPFSKYNQDDVVVDLDKTSYPLNYYIVNLGKENTTSV